MVLHHAMWALMANIQIWEAVFRLILSALNFEVVSIVIFGLASLSSSASVPCQLGHLLEYFVLHLIVSGLMAMMARRSLPPGQSRSGRPTWNSFCEYLDPWGARNNSMQQLYAKCTVMHPYPLMSLFIFGFYVVNKCSLNIIQTWISAAANRPPISQAESWLIPSLGTNLSIWAVFFKSPGWRGGEAELETGGGEGVLLPLEAPLQVVQQDHQAVWALVSPKQSNSVGKACNGKVIPRRLLLRKLFYLTPAQLPPPRLSWEASPALPEQYLSLWWKDNDNDYRVPCVPLDGGDFWHRVTVSDSDGDCTW